MTDAGSRRLVSRAAGRGGVYIALILLIGLRAGATSSVDADIGGATPAGASAFHAGVYTISGGGKGTWNTSDQFHFDKGFLAGSGTMTAKVESASGPDRGAKSGVMLRADQSPGSSFADVSVSPGHGVTFTWRSKAGAKCDAVTATSVKAPVWLCVSRAASGAPGRWTVTGSYSRDGVGWTQIGKPVSVALPATALAGLAVTSHHPGALSVGTFTRAIVRPNVDGRYLHTQGNIVCDRAGRPITLRGTNIGGWLVNEGWMTGQTDSGGGNSGRFQLEQLEARFGVDKAAALMNVWRDSWFTDRDMDNISSYGFNLIRVPFSWRNLQDASGNWYRDADGGIDFSRFDWVVQEAAKRGIYVIFDYHIWPGQQKDYGSICQAGEPGATQRAQSAAIWSQVARHFRGNGTVAAFDLINEPTGSNDFYDAHRAFYAAIRAEDPKRMLVAEWVNTADFAKLGWTDTICSGHYPAGNQADFNKFLAELPKHNEYSTTLPCFVGECKSDDSKDVTQNAADMTLVMDRLNWSWATWTYKTVNEGGWGLFDYDDSLRYDLSKDTYESILSLWQNGLTQWENPPQPKNYYLKSDIISGLQQGAAASSVAKSP